ncbi:MAG TPA: hypothetical protein PKH78_09455, partial [Candidatus Obscuribacter sp.]|nr:hypothetical protein [Candidatus Obscuribacter sp.]
MSAGHHKICLCHQSLGRVGSLRHCRKRTLNKDEKYQAERGSDGHGAALLGGVLIILHPDLQSV